MVIADLSHPQTKPESSNTPRYAVAPIADRLVALLLDFLIFSPVISLLVAGLIRQGKTAFILNANSIEGMISISLVSGVIFLMTALLQAVFLFFWQATPGQLFLQLRVASFPASQERLTLNQCLVRSFLWSLSLFAMALPFVEILGHPLRRAFHEKASDTLVVTLKQKRHSVGEAPALIETRFVSSFMRLSFLFALLLSVQLSFRTYQNLKSGIYRGDVASAGPELCREIDNGEGSVGSARLDAAMSLFLLDEISAECLIKEAEASLWGDPVNNQELAYLAQFLTHQGGEQEAYRTQVCQKKTSQACLLAQYLGDKGTAIELAQISDPLLTTRLLMSDEEYVAGKYVESLKHIETLQKNLLLKQPLEKRFVRSVWALREQEKSPQKDRQPASVSVSTKWVEKFKEKYEVP